MNDLFHLFNSNVSIGQALLYSVIGLAVVFLMLAILMVIIRIMAAIMEKAIKKPQISESAEPPAETPKAPPAPGSAGELKLVGVTEREAAMIMAIVADNMGKPINELRFKSIREVKEDEI